MVVLSVVVEGVDVVVAGEAEGTPRALPPPPPLGKSWGISSEARPRMSAFNRRFFEGVRWPVMRSYSSLATLMLPSLSLSGGGGVAGSVEDGSRCLFVPILRVNCLLAFAIFGLYIKSYPTQARGYPLV